MANNCDPMHGLAIYVAHFNTSIPGYELKYFCTGAGRSVTDTLVKSGQARSGSSICEFFDDLYHTIDSGSDHYLFKR